MRGCHDRTSHRLGKHQGVLAGAMTYVLRRTLFDVVAERLGVSDAGLKGGLSTSAEPQNGGSSGHRYAVGTSGGGGLVR
jgi:hypothetical protein